MSDDARVERSFHNAVWALANQSGDIERAAWQARQLCYAILNESKDRKLLVTLANLWLDSYGRDALIEGR